MADILIVDDDRGFGALLSRAVERKGHRVEHALDLASGFARAEAGAFDLVLLDVGLPDGDGLSAIAGMKHVASAPEVLIITGEADGDGAAVAIESGAWDYLPKGGTLHELVLPVETALARRAQVAAAGKTRALDRGPLVGESPAMKRCYDLLAQAASGEACVLVTGETGTGKELFARSVHDNSARRGGPFVTVDCAALPEHLVEGTLFGHARGAFTGASEERVGLVREADRGTLFLDEVGELPLNTQKAFLRVLQERRFRPVGGRREMASDFRLVAATNRDLDEMVRQGLFREDLLFRLRALEIPLPALRDRAGDVRALVAALLPLRCRRNGVDARGVSEATLSLLESYPWPGNVRELVQALDRAIAGSFDSESLSPAHLPSAIRIHAARARLAQKPGGLRLVVARPERWKPTTFREARDVACARYLRALMDHTDGDIDEACGLAEVSRSHLYDLLRAHGVERRPGVSGTAVAS